MESRLSKCLLLAGVAFFYTLVVLNNTTDYGSNYQFVHHVLLMDTTFPGNHEMWRSIHSEKIQTLFYLVIILWEALTTALCWWATLRMTRALNAPPDSFERTKRIAVVALTSGMLMWFVAFLAVGGEWFLTWQSPTWNGQDAAFRIFAVLGIVLIYLVLPEPVPQDR